MMYPSLTAREILTTPIADIWSFAKGVYEVIFDDSRSLYMYHSHICFNRLLWEFFKEFPDGQITPNHAFIGDTCHCGKPATETYSRIVGFLVPYSSFSKERKEEFDNRIWQEVSPYDM